MVWTWSLHLQISYIQLTPYADLPQVQLSAADSDRKQLLEAFTVERAKRESEALIARRGLESQLEALVGAVCESGEEVRYDTN